MVLHDRVIFWEQNSGVPSGLMEASTESQKTDRRITDLSIDVGVGCRRTLESWKSWKSWKKWKKWEK